MIRRFLALLAASATAAAGLVALQVTAPAPELAGLDAANAAASAGDWDPGNIISDENFYNGDAMDGGAVQSFLVSRNSSSSPTALRNYAQVTPSIPADQYCAAYSGGYQSAADIIAGVGKACNFSQKAMLVLLEKEQSLLSLSAPTMGRLAAATGFGCPDTAACDSSVAGFFYQVYYAARQFQVYKANPYSYNHIPFATNNVLYNPNFSCGSSPVFISNYATAGLYNYTPYQPNQAALNNLRGTGDGCSAYGNRNFWWMYTDWFGDSRGPVTSSSPSLIVAQGSSETFLLSEGTRYFIPAEYVDRYKAALGEVTEIPATGMSWIPWGPWARDILTGADGTPYYLTPSGTLFQFRNCQVVSDFGSSCDLKPKLSAAQSAAIPAAGMLESFVESSDGRVTLVQGGVKREVANLDVLTKMGYFTRTTKDVPAELLSGLPFGDPIVSAGSVIASDEAAAPLLISSTHAGYAVPESMKALPGLATTATFSPESYAAITQGASLAPLMTDGQSSYLATDKGLLRVSAAQYGGGVSFASVPADALKGLPSAGDALGAHFVQMAGESTVQLIAGGERFELANTDAVKAEADKRGISATVHQTVAGAVSGVNPGNGIVTGSLLKPQGTNDLYLLDGMHLQPIASVEIAKALGFTQAPITITTASFENIQQRETSVDGTQLTCNGVTGLAVNGELRPYANAEVQAAYGLTSESLSGELCALIPTSSSVMSDVFNTSDGTVYWVSGGEKRPIGWPELATEMGAYDRLVKLSDVEAAQLPTGAYLVSVPEGYTPPSEAPVTEPTPEPTPAPTPTAEPTEAPEPTSTSTATPTSSATPEPTSSATAEPTATATPTPTQEPAVPLETGDVITDAAASGLWLVNGDQLLQIGSSEVAMQLGIIVSEPQVVPAANFAEFAGAKTVPLYTSAVQCGDTASIGIGGSLVGFESAEVQAAYGLTHVQLAPEICATLTVSPEKLGTEVVLPNGNTYLVENGALRLKTAVGYTAEPSTSAASTEPATTEPAASEPGTEPAPTASATAEATPEATPTGEAEPSATPTAPQAEALMLPIQVVSAMLRGEPLPG